MQVERGCVRASRDLFIGAKLVSPSAARSLRGLAALGKEYSNSYVMRHEMLERSLAPPRTQNLPWQNSPHFTERMAALARLGMNDALIC